MTKFYFTLVYLSSEGKCYVHRLFGCQHAIITMQQYLSVHLKVTVDVSNESQGGKEGDGAQHEEEDVAAQGCVAKELHRLQRAVHVASLVVVEESIAKHKEPSGTVCV